MLSIALWNILQFPILKKENFKKKCSFEIHDKFCANCNKIFQINFVDEIVITQTDNQKFVWRVENAQKSI